MGLIIHAMLWSLSVVKSVIIRNLPEKIIKLLKIPLIIMLVTG